ncbi:MAG: guanylate kinase [Deltaproteobacteria bacterium]|nr:guanylate kinase [Deltaproteobacteria bacterium]
MKGIPFIVSAPSGAGKTTLCNMAVEFFPDLRHSISYTTRSPRPGDKNGVDYRFVDDKEFESMIAAGEFLEYAVVHGKRYGTSKKDLEKMLVQGVNVLLDIDVQGAEKVRKRLERGVYVFILPPSIKDCEDRLKTRAKDSKEEIEKRLKTAALEVRRALDYDYIIINDDLGRAFEMLKSIIISEKSKKLNMAETIKRLYAGQ